MDSNFRFRARLPRFFSLRVSGSFKIVRVPLEETDGRELRRPLSRPAAVCRAVSDSDSMRSSSDKGDMVSAGIGSATGLRLAASTRHSNAAGLVPGLPLMHPAFYIRPARVEEAAALSDLCFRSEAVWGYDPEFMALILAALGVAGEDIAAD